MKDAQQIKRDRLRRYAERDPKEFVQIDCWLNGDPIMGAAPQGGHALTGARTVELMHGSDVRILIPRGVARSDIVVLLQKAIGWIERGGPGEWIDSASDELEPGPCANGNVVPFPLTRSKRSSSALEEMQRQIDEHLRNYVPRPLCSCGNPFCTDCEGDSA